MHSQGQNYRYLVNFQAKLRGIYWVLSTSGVRQPLAGSILVTNFGLNSLSLFYGCFHQMKLVIRVNRTLHMGRKDSGMGILE